MNTRLLSISDQIYGSLLQRILEGGLPPGTRLVETKLAEQFRSSRLPVREALQRLAGERLVEIEPRRGTFVARLDPARTSEIIDIIGVLRALAASRAAEKATVDDLERMRAGLEKVKEAIDGGHTIGYPRGIYDIDEHIINIAGNQTLGEMLSKLSTQIKMIRTYSPSRSDKALLIEIWQENSAVYAGIEARDPTAAATRTIAHLEGVKRRLMEHLEYRESGESKWKAR